MKFLVFRAIFLLVFVSQSGYAGTLINGEWTFTSCGSKPATPEIKDNNAEAYNNTVKAINEWQQNITTYYQCMVNEANQDNGIIANKANQEQADYRKSIEGISAALEKAKSKLDKP